MSTFYLFLPVLLLCSAYVALSGGASERWSAAMQVVAFVLGFRWWQRLYVPELPIASFFLIDLLLLLLLVVLAIRSSRFWPIWVAGFQCAAVIVHLSKTLVPAMTPQGYSILLQIWGYPMILLTAAGSYWHRRRCRTGAARCSKTRDGGS